VGGESRDTYAGGNVRSGINTTEFNLLRLGIRFRVWGKYDTLGLLKLESEMSITQIHEM
jgi:hypothetical protein